MVFSSFFFFFLLLRLQPLIDNIGHLHASDNLIFDSPKFLDLLSCCHSIREIDGKLIGDPMDLKMFEFTNWVFFFSFQFSFFLSFFSISKIKLFFFFF